MYEWSILLHPRSPLKRAVDCVLCSICCVHPQFFGLLLQWMGIVVAVDWGGISETCATDDRKGSNSRQNDKPVTDDVKARGGARPAVEEERERNQPIVLQDFSRLVLQEVHNIVILMFEIISSLIKAR